MKSMKIAGALLALLVGSAGLGPVARAGDDIPYTDTFRFDKCRFTHRGANDYFIPLKENAFIFLEGEEENDEGDPEEVAVFIKVLAWTKVVAGVRCAVIREVEWIDEELVEVSWNYFAICKVHGDVVYFGEDVNIYEDGQVVSHDGAWLAGRNGARPGIIMPGGLPLIGSRYYQELAPGVALDRAEHLDNETTVSTPAGTFNNCLYVVETTPLEPGHDSFKAYARGIGLILDSVLRLTNYGVDD